MRWGEMVLQRDRRQNVPDAARLVGELPKLLKSEAL
jgi:hypothetical protein